MRNRVIRGRIFSVNGCEIVELCFYALGKVNHRRKDFSKLQEVLAEMVQVYEAGGFSSGCTPIAH